MKTENIAKIYLNENGLILKQEDTTFLVTGRSNVDFIQLLVPYSVESSIVQVSFERSDGFVISNRQMDYIETLDPASGADVEFPTVVYQYGFKQEDRILDISGQLQVSFEVKNTETNEVYATAVTCLYVRRNVKPNLETTTEEEFYQQALDVVEKAQSDINRHRQDFENPHRVRADQVPISTVNKTLVSAKLDSIDTSIQGANSKITVLQAKDEQLKQQIAENAQIAKDYTDESSQNAQRQINLNSNSIEELRSIKLNEVFNDIAIANEVADSDYFIINSGNKAYRVTLQSLKSILGGGGGGENHYKGDFLSYDELTSTYPTANPGDYAFVNIGTWLIMYIWDESGIDESGQGIWRETDTDKYVSTVTFANFQEMILNGTIIADTAKNYATGNGEKSSINDAFTRLENTITEEMANLSAKIEENDGIYLNSINDAFSNKNKILELCQKNQAYKIKFKGYEYDGLSSLSTKYVIIFKKWVKKTVSTSNGTELRLGYSDYQMGVDKTTAAITREGEYNSDTTSFDGRYFDITSSTIKNRIATNDDIIEGTDDYKAITSKGLKEYMDSTGGGYTVPTVYISTTETYGTFTGNDLTNLQNDPNTIIYQANTEGSNDAYTILGETAGTRTFGNFKGNIVYKIEVNLADGTWVKTTVDIATQEELDAISLKGVVEDLGIFSDIEEIIQIMLSKQSGIYKATILQDGLSTTALFAHTSNGEGMIMGTLMYVPSTGSGIYTYTIIPALGKFDILEIPLESGNVLASTLQAQLINETLEIVIGNSDNPTAGHTSVDLSPLKQSSNLISTNIIPTVGTERYVIFDGDGGTFKIGERYRFKFAINNERYFVDFDVDSTSAIISSTFSMIGTANDGYGHFKHNVNSSELELYFIKMVDNTEIGEELAPTLTNMEILKF
ncbi:MAG: hypothetical protein NC182_01610 [Prevotella sp.]|nr:hypothetical protein [Staphylococcus sp.]MCM1349879.1 hypothetical protein [Prevotella sp.]